jgi:hypothetical protein
MANFTYLFRGNPANFRSLSPEQMEQRMKSWMRWMDTLRQQGHLEKGGERLDFTGKVVRGQTKTVTDGPYVEAKDSISGFLIVSAKDLDQATELSKGCPILEGGEGSVEVRPIMPM